MLIVLTSCNKQSALLDNIFLFMTIFEVIVQAYRDKGCTSTISTECGFLFFLFLYASCKFFRIFFIASFALSNLPRVLICTLYFVTFVKSGNIRDVSEKFVKHNWR